LDGAYGEELQYHLLRALRGTRLSKFPEENIAFLFDQLLSQRSQFAREWAERLISLEKMSAEATKHTQTSLDDVRDKLNSFMESTHSRLSEADRVKEEPRSSPIWFGSMHDGQKATTTLRLSGAASKSKAFADHSVS
jgi:hypothetical protein